MTASLPSEILLKIFQRLPLYSQRQCSQVCQSWNTVARTFANNEKQRVVFDGRTGALSFLQDISSDPAQGLSIRQMYFMPQNRYDLIIPQNEFENLMRACQFRAEKEQLTLGNLEKELVKTAAIDQVIERRPTSQLETLKIDHDFLSQDLYSYLKCHCPYLSRLAFYIEPYGNVDPLVNTLAAFDQDGALPITSLSITANLMVANRLTSSLNKWFPRVRQLDLSCFDIGRATNNNFCVDLNQMNLSYLSLDLGRFFESNNNTPSASVVALQVVTPQNSTTLWYQIEDEKWKTDKRNVLKNGIHLINVPAAVKQENQMLSDTTIVITVKELLELVGFLAYH
ncbi:hypothetical protein FB192DRAFT_1460621 [Mucor lusitanicus]|uniref:F-box domain-containing protein n=1 Tax=Mucor circinelloides f. lusitanicus TaxID=29924 RepID=A0A8H4BDX4_MUCCL|nr:hypothetical protein FB192DRAFT_1460621 [Mucor lusitanicus]